MEGRARVREARECKGQDAKECGRKVQKWTRGRYRWTGELK